MIYNGYNIRIIDGYHKGHLFQSSYRVGQGFVFTMRERPEFKPVDMSEFKINEAVLQDKRHDYCTWIVMRHGEPVALAGIPAKITNHEEVSRIIQGYYER